MCLNNDNIEKAFDELELHTDLDEEEFYDPDAHSCSAEADEAGICTVCGAVIYGSVEYHELTGSDPWGTW